MAQYKVVSKKMPQFKHGSMVDESDLVGANIQALLDGGHIAVIGNKSFKKENDKQPKVEE